MNETQENARKLAKILRSGYPEPGRGGAERSECPPVRVVRPFSSSCDMASFICNAALSIRDAARHVATKTVQARIPESSRSEPDFYRLAGLDIPISVGAVPSAASARPSAHGLQAYFHLPAVWRASQKGLPVSLGCLPSLDLPHAQKGMSLATHALNLATSVCKPSASPRVLSAARGMRLSARGRIPLADIPAVGLAVHDR